MQRRAEAFHRYGNEVPSRTCPTCGQRLFTGVGLDEHVRLGTHGNLGLVVQSAAADGHRVHVG